MTSLTQHSGSLNNAVTFLFFFSYDETRGRHVLAKKNIRKGEVLFVEKAFLFAPIFKDEKEFHPFKCYNCLKDVISSVP